MSNPVDQIDQKTDDAALDDDGLYRHSWWSPRAAYFFSGALTIILFLADVMLPEGATVAIGYCVVPAIAAGSRRRGFLFGVTIICTILNWIAPFFEPDRGAAWEPAFNRVMVTVVLWLALYLVLRRTTILRALVRQTRALKHTTRELERSNGELTKFSSVVAHDLRGPLNTVGLLVQLLPGLDANKADNELTQCISSIDVELRRMGAFIQNLLYYGRVDGGDLMLSDCDCTDILSHVLQNLKADLDSNSAQISNDPLPIIRADAVLISQLFQNLVENSLKYRREAPPHIHISATQEPGWWLFSVRDNGIGIRPEDFERIFKAFGQADGARSMAKGVGLGLTTCKRIVERHGGRIHVESTAGDGATFVFTIPQDSITASPAIFTSHQRGT